MIEYDRDISCSMIDSESHFWLVPKFMRIQERMISMSIKEYLLFLDFTLAGEALSTIGRNDRSAHHARNHPKVREDRGEETSPSLCFGREEREGLQTWQ